MNGTWLRRALTGSLTLLCFSWFPLTQAVPPTWSPTDHNPVLTPTTYSVTRTDMLHNGAWVTQRSDLSQSAGVHYVEFYITQATVQVGLANAAAPINNYIGADQNGLGYRQNGNVIKGALWVGTVPLPPTFTSGDTLGMLTDFNAHTVKFNKNNGAWSGAIDISSLGPDIYVAVSLSDNAPTHIPTSAVRINIASDWGGPNVNIVAAGDSITLGGGTPCAYVCQLGKLATHHGIASITKAGINGATWNYTALSNAGYSYTIIQDAPLRVDPERVTDIPSWLITWAGTNGLVTYHRTAAQECIDAKTYLDARVAAGQIAAHTIVVPMLPRNGILETIRTAYNACLRTLGYPVAVLDLDLRIGCAGCNTNPQYFQSDQIHLNDAGAGIAAGYFEQMIYH